jgi:hypothetical protein
MSLTGVLMMLATAMLLSPLVLLDSTAWKLGRQYVYIRLEPCALTVSYFAPHLG